jgi:hypothetical protein
MCSKWLLGSQYELLLIIGAVYSTLRCICILENTPSPPGEGDIGRYLLGESVIREEEKRGNVKD